LPKPFRGTLPKARYSKSSPRRRRVLPSMTTAFGSASPCSRAARLGVSPTGLVFLRQTLAEQSPDHHQTSGNANSHLQSHPRAITELRHGTDQCQPCAHRALGVVLVRLRIAEIDQHTVAHISGYNATRLHDLL